MNERIMAALAPLRRTFASFTNTQKAISVVGAVALLIGGFLVFRWASAPSYAPAFTNVAPSDASAIVDKLDADGTPYKLTGGGSTILVPRDEVYDARIKLSGEGLPTDDSSGYSLLDKQDLSTSQFQEQTGFKRAMEGELSKTVGGIDGVDTAVVHLAMPQEEVFADEQKPTTASVLVDTGAGATLDSGQVQAIVHLVASSIEGLDPDNVTVADSSGKVLSESGDGFDTVADDRSQQVQGFEARTSDTVQKMLDRVVGAGNSTVQVTADLNFDKTVTNTTRYFSNPKTAPLSDTSTSEKYSSPQGGGNGGVVGPDGQLDPGAGAGGGNGASNYTKKQRTSDNAVGKSVEQKEAAPGNVRSLHVGVVLDSQSIDGVDPTKVQDLIASSLGIDQKRGDTVDVSAMAFDRTAEDAAAKELADAKKAEDRGKLISLLRTVGMVVLLASIFFAAWLRSRRRRKARNEATTYVVEQLRRDSVEKAEKPALESSALDALAAAPTAHNLPDVNAATRDEISALIERQPEEVAQLLRGWLVDHGE